LSVPFPDTSSSEDFEDLEEFLKGDVSLSKDRVECSRLHAPEKRHHDRPRRIRRMNEVIVASGDIGDLES